MNIHPCGDRALTVELGDRIDESVNARVCKLAALISQTKLPGVQETVPTFRALLVLYDPGITSYPKLRRALTRLLTKCEHADAAGGRIFELPVLYNGPDLPDVAAHAGISESEVVARHSKPAYLIYMLGFLPGFAYLGGLDPSIVTPRLTTPRTKIPAGAVGIGGEQTGIYPLDSPGGWRLIGMTPVKPYDPAREEPILYRAGDRIRFIPVDQAVYDKIRAEVEAGTYRGHVTGGGV